MTRNEPPGSDPALYDADFFTWTQRQAAALRTMPRGAAVDTEHVAEEIGDLGKSELNRVTAFLGLMLQHVIKLRAAPTSAMPGTDTRKRATSSRRRAGRSLPACGSSSIWTRFGSMPRGPCAASSTRSAAAEIQ